MVSVTAGTLPLTTDSSADDASIDLTPLRARLSENLIQEMQGLLCIHLHLGEYQTVW